MLLHDYGNKQLILKQYNKNNQLIDKEEDEIEKTKIELNRIFKSYVQLFNSNLQ